MLTLGVINIVIPNLEKVWNLYIVKLLHKGGILATCNLVDIPCIYMYVENQVSTVAEYTVA